MPSAASRTRFFQAPAAGPLAPDTHVFICGPARMAEKITTELRRHGLSRNYVHTEHFAFR